MTELEVIKAAFIDFLPHCYFYIRGAPEDLTSNVTDEEKEATEALKNRVENSSYVVHHFRTPEELGKLVLEDWKSLVNQLFPAPQTFSDGSKGKQKTSWFMQFKDASPM